jgi:putative transposase
MSRRPRLQYPGAVYHVMSRGNRKGAIFEDDVDRRRFLSIVELTASRYDLRVYGFCLMGNHYHLVFDTPRGNLSDAMRGINGCYTQASNRRHKRTGHVFEGRFRSIVVERASYLRRVCRYAVLNPVRSGLTGDPGAWPWSSYRATAGLDAPPAFLYLDWLDWAFAANSREEAQRQYRLYVNEPVPKKERLDIGALVLGRPEFECGVRDAALAVAAADDRPVPRTCRALSRPTLQELFSVSSGTRDARNRLIRRAHVEHGYRLAEIATFLQLHPSTASLIVRRLDG